MPKTHSKEYKAFLKRLREARRSAGLTQAEVADRLGQHQSFVAKCESGERRVDVIELGQFAKVYGKGLGYFIKQNPSRHG